jgi:hypothetical protein
MSKMKCLMCEENPAKPLTAKRGENIYINAVDVILFCSIRCAANYGLLWFDIEGQHWCEKLNKWMSCEKSRCSECNPE